MANLSSKSPTLPFFVYGTLLPGQPNHALLRGKVVAQETAWLQNGRLYDIGQYPMLVEEPSYTVKGMVLAIQPTAYEWVMNQLDILEGYSPLNLADSVYHRVPRAVHTESGNELVAWVYTVQTHHVIGFDPIESGDWASHAADKRARLAEWWRTVSSVADLYGRFNE